MRATELTPQQIAELDALAAMLDEDIDTSDIPEIEGSTVWRGPLSEFVRAMAASRTPAIERAMRTPAAKSN